ncbi:MAG: glycosyltransferase, partial [Candidatus Hodarchaeota archaeon]
MKISRYLLYGSVWVIVFVLFHMYLAPFWSSGVKRAIDRFILDPLIYWSFIFPLIGLVMLWGFVIFYGIHFLASFGRGYRTKKPYYTYISILIACKNEKVLLERTLNSIIESNYPMDNVQIIIITSGSTDDTTDFCRNFAKEHHTMAIEVLSEDLPKKGKPPALNYGLKY